MVHIAKVLVYTVTIFGIFFADHALADPPSDPVKNFNAAKKLARNIIYKNHQITLYCGCKFVHSQTASGGKISKADCGYKPRKNKKRGKQLEWEHIMPAWFFGRERECWINGHALCQTRKGKKYQGRKCCAKVDEEFKRIEADLHNLAPTVGELNGDRLNFAYGIIEGESRVYGRCDFEVNRRAQIAEPADGIRGDVARVWLYMSETYGIKLETRDKLMFDEWAEKDPPDEWEFKRNIRIRNVQGNDNPFVTGF